VSLAFLSHFAANFFDTSSQNAGGEGVRMGWCSSANSITGGLACREGCALHVWPVLLMAWYTCACAHHAARTATPYDNNVYQS
jgi:hypothetical protein